MTAQVISSDGIKGEIVHRALPNRPDGRVGGVKIMTDTMPYDSRIKQLADKWECAAEDFSHIGERGLVGKPSPAAAARIGRVALRMGKACAWTLADCVLVMRETGAGYDAIARKLGISDSLAEKYARMGRAFATDERHAGLDFTVHEEVCALLPAVREGILLKAASEGLSAAKVRELAKAAKPVAARNGMGRKAKAMPAIADANYDKSVTPEARGAFMPPQAVQSIKLWLDADLSRQLLEGQTWNSATDLLAEIVRAYLAQKGE